MGLLYVKVLECDFDNFVSCCQERVEQAVYGCGVAAGVVRTAEGSVLLAVRGRVDQAFTG